MNPDKPTYRNDLWRFPRISTGNWTLYHDKPPKGGGGANERRVKASKPRRKMAKASRRINRK